MSSWLSAMFALICDQPYQRRTVARSNSPINKGITIILWYWKLKTNCIERRTFWPTFRMIIKKILVKLCKLHRTSSYLTNSWLGSLRGSWSSGTLGRRSCSIFWNPLGNSTAFAGNLKMSFSLHMKTAASPCGMLRTVLRYKLHTLHTDHTRASPLESYTARKHRTRNGVFLGSNMSQVPFCLKCYI